jgi:hypothetical protein
MSSLRTSLPWSGSRPCDGTNRPLSTQSMLNIPIREKDACGIVLLKRARLEV